MIFERGICIFKNQAGDWYHANSEKPTLVSDPSNLVTCFGLRPVIAERLNENDRVTLVLPAFRGKLLEIYRREIDLTEPLKYLMGSMLHHCAALAHIYADACNRYVTTLSKKTAEKDPTSGDKRKHVASLDEPFYGFETLMTKILVGYELIRQPIWRKYKSGRKKPRNFADTVKYCNLPSALGKRIVLSMEKCYLPAKKFRNCIQDNVDVGTSSWCLLEKKFQLLWMLSVHIPDNPDERKASAFTFNQGLDALSVAWESVSEFFALTDILFGEGALSSFPQKQGPIKGLHP